MMITSEMKELIKKLTQQVNLDSISTKDMVKELSELYDSVERYEAEIVSLSKKVQDKEELVRALNNDLDRYRKEYVVPAVEYQTKTKDLEKEKFAFDLERKYICREHTLLSEIVKSSLMIAQKSVWRGSDGAYSETINTFSPNIPPLPIK